MSKPRPQPESLGSLLRLLAQEVGEALDRRLAAHGVSAAQWAVLRVLGAHEKISLATLGAALDMDKGALSRMIGRLVALGLVRRVGNPQSRREVSLSLTPKARALAPRLAREAARSDETFFAALTVRQRAELRKSIGLLIAVRVGKTPRRSSA